MHVIPPTPLSVSTMESTQNGPIATVTVTINQPAAAHHYEWYEDGRTVGPSFDPEHGLAVEVGEPVEVACIPTRYETFNAQANAPLSYPAYIEIEWKSAEDDSDVDYYRVDHIIGTSAEPAADAAWVEIGRLERTGEWNYQFRTESLADLNWHWLRVAAVGLNGNAGTALVFSSRTQHVRRPDAPNVTTSFDDGTQKVTFTAAA